LHDSNPQVSDEVAASIAFTRRHFDANPAKATNPK